MNVKGTTVKILVVDDQPSNRHLLSSVLKNAGYAVDTAASGEASVVLLERNRYQVVLLDILLGTVSGLDVLDRIREQQCVNRDAVVIVYTSDATPRMRHQAADRGASMFLERPIRPSALLEAIGALLGDEHSPTIN